MQLNLFCSIFQNGVCSLENDPTNIDIGYVFLLSSGNLFVCPKVFHFSRFGGCLCSAVFCRCTQTPAPTSHWPCGSLVFASLHDWGAGGGDPYKAIRCSKNTQHKRQNPWFVSCMFTTGVFKKNSNHSKSWSFFFPHRPPAQFFVKKVRHRSTAGPRFSLESPSKVRAGMKPSFFGGKRGEGVERASAIDLP